MRVYLLQRQEIYVNWKFRILRRAKRKKKREICDTIELTVYYPPLKSSSRILYFSKFRRFWSVSRILYNIYVFPDSSFELQTFPEPFPDSLTFMFSRIHHLPFSFQNLLSSILQAPKISFFTLPPPSKCS